MTASTREPRKKQNSDENPEKIRIVKRIDDSVKLLDGIGADDEKILRNVFEHMKDFLALSEMCGESEMLQFAKEYRGFSRFSILVSSIARAIDKTGRKCTASQ